MALPPLVVVRGQTLCQLCSFLAMLFLSPLSLSSSIPLFFPSILPFLLFLSIRDPIQRTPVILLAELSGVWRKHAEKTCCSLSEGLEMP